MTEALNTSATSVYEITWLNIPEDCHLNVKLCRESGRTQAQGSISANRSTLRHLQWHHNIHSVAYQVNIWLPKMLWCTESVIFNCWQFDMSRSKYSVIFSLRIFCLVNFLDLLCIQKKISERNVYHHLSRVTINRFSLPANISYIILCMDMY
jgi:hypothetical protein